MKSNAHLRRLLKMPHWISNTQKVVWFKQFYDKEGQWNVIRTKHADYCYSSSNIAQKYNAKNPILVTKECKERLSNMDVEARSQFLYGFWSHPRWADKR